MHLSDLPQSHHVMTKAHRNFLAAAILYSLSTMGAEEDRPLMTHFSRIEGGSQDGFVYGMKEFPGSQPLPQPRDSVEIATVLVDSVDDVKYYPPVRRHSVKGWEIRAARIGDVPVVIAWAKWTTVQ